MLLFQLFLRANKILKIYKYRLNVVTVGKYLTKLTFEPVKSLEETPASLVKTPELQMGTAPVQLQGSESSKELVNQELSTIFIIQSTFSLNETEGGTELC